MIDGNPDVDHGITITHWLENKRAELESISKKERVGR